MSSSTRLYERLEQIPTEPEDPESLEDVVVCAFGAFERYYVCWKTRGGAYRQDSHDLPPDLEEFLFAEEGTRDFPSLQVVFGRGNEFFASDSNGKLEYKEPEPEKKEHTPETREEKRALRRSRTISFMRPRSDESQKATFLDIDSLSSNKRSSLINGRPPSLSRSSRSNSDASLHSQPDSRSYARPNSDLSISFESRTSSNQTTIPSRSPSILDSTMDDPTTEVVADEKTIAPPPVPASSQSTRRLRPLSMSFKAGLIPRIPEGQRVPPAEAPSPPSPLPPVPPIPQVSALSVATPSRPDPVSQPELHPLQLKPRVADTAPATRSISPPFQSPEQNESLVDTVPTLFPALSLGGIKTTAHTAPTMNSPAFSSLQIITTAVQTTPISPMLAKASAPPTLSNSFSTISTTPINPPPPLRSVQVPAQRFRVATSSISTQTSPPASPLRTALRIDTNTSAPYFPPDSYSLSTSSSTMDMETPQDYDYYEPPPVFMGRMMDYYSKPGYQLGESLFGAYSVRDRVAMLDEMSGEEELSEWERANGRGY